MSSNKSIDYTQKEAGFFSPQWLQKFPRSFHFTQHPIFQMRTYSRFSLRQKHTYKKNRYLCIYYFGEQMLNWFLAASEEFLQLFYASVEALMLIYVVYWNLDLAWWEIVQWNHVTVFKGYKRFPQVRCSILQNSFNTNNSQ